MRALFLAVFLLTTRAAAQEAAVVDPVSVRAGEVRCTVTDRGAVPAGDARTAADLICGELLERGSPPEAYEIRFGKLDANVLVTVTRTGRPTSRRILLSGLSELPVAAPRLATALVNDKPLAETEGADNVVAADARRPTTKNGTLAAVGEIIGITHTGSDPSLSAGFGLGIDFRLQNIAIGARGRAGGIGDASRKLSFASADVGARLYPSEGATAFYGGGGLVVAHWSIAPLDGNVARADLAGRAGSGLGAFAEVGVETFRNAKVGLNVSARADLPFFSLDGEYVAPLSLNVGMAFR